MEKFLDPRNPMDVDWLANYVSYYLGETVEDLTEWDCEHLAMNMLNELRIEKPQWAKEEENELS